MENVPACSPVRGAEREMTALQEASWQEKVVENIQVKEVEMENLTEALVKSKRMVSELRTCHVSSVTHQQEVELKTELMEVEKLWIREKVDLEDWLEVERKRIAQLARELGES